MSNSTRCAACKSLRRRCSQDCVLAPYFQENNLERFSCVHKIYGSNNVTKLLEGREIIKFVNSRPSLWMHSNNFSIATTNNPDPV
ncbi:hypothetical protein ACSBR2_020397 [Camellia fascicularis]